MTTYMATSDKFKATNDKVYGNNISFINKYHRHVNIVNFICRPYDICYCFIECEEQFEFLLCSCGDFTMFLSAQVEMNEKDEALYVYNYCYVISKYVYTVLQSCQ